MSCYIPNINNQGSLRDDLINLNHAIMGWSRGCDKVDILYPLTYTLRYKLIPTIESQQEEIDQLKQELKNIKKELNKIKSNNHEIL